MIYLMTIKEMSHCKETKSFGFTFHETTMEDDDDDDMVHRFDLSVVR